MVNTISSKLTSNNSLMIAFTSIANLLFSKQCEKREGFICMHLFICIHIYVVNICSSHRSLQCTVRFKSRDPGSISCTDFWPWDSLL